MRLNILTQTALVRIFLTFSQHKSLYDIIIRWTGNLNARLVQIHAAFDQLFPKFVTKSEEKMSKTNEARVILI